MAGGNLAVVGAQWGDEGKGKVVDLFSDRFDVVARYQGGPNAGHTVTIGGRRHALQHIPSGVFRPDARIVIGVDTGLVHLSAALGRPTLALFCASDPALTGVVASTPAINLGSRGRPPSVEHVLAAALPLL